MSDRPTASIVIPVLNGEATIGDTLRALHAQAGGLEGVEIIVVDNGSTDATIAVVSGYPVRILHEAVRGVSAARNHGLREARGEVYINVDADTVPSRVWLREMLAAFSDPSVILVGGRILSLPPQNAVERYIDQSGLHQPQYSIENPVMPFVVGCNLAVRRTAAIAVGGWNEALPRGDDVDFSTRLLRHFDTRIHYQPSATLFHRHRVDEEGLCRQAWGYGHGMALLYPLYPEQLDWNRWKLLHIARILATRFLTEGWTTAGHRLGWVSGDRREFAHYHRKWGWYFWRGFLNAFYGDRRLSP